MSTAKNILGWAGIVLLGLAHGILEDLMFLRVLVEHMPPTWDLTGDLFFRFTVPLSQLLALAITLPITWFMLGVYRLPRLVTLWACWSLARSAFLFQLKNPVGDVATYLAWIAFWCIAIGCLAHLRGKLRPAGA